MSFILNGYRSDSLSYQVNTIWVMIVSWSCQSYNTINESWPLGLGTTDQVDSCFSPSLAEDSPHSTSFFLLKKCVISSAITVTWLDPKTASLCYEALCVFQCLYCRLAETSLRSRSGFGISWNIELATFLSAYIFNSQNWISARILRVSKREFRALHSSGLKAFRKKFHYCWFHSKVNFFRRFWCLFGLCHFWHILVQIL